MDSREQRIATLAATLKSSGIAKSEAQAKMMAEDMVGVEDKVQKKSEEHHAAAHDHIQTAKNLGDHRIISKPQVQEVKKPNPVGTYHSEPVVPTRSNSTRGSMSSDYPNVSGISLGSSSKTTTSSHDTHNSLIESIKAQVSQQEIPSLYDQYMEKTKDSVKPHIQSGSSNDYVDYLHQKPIMNDQRISPINSTDDSKDELPSHAEHYVEIDNLKDLSKHQNIEHATSDLAQDTKSRIIEESVPGKLVQELKLEVYHDVVEEESLSKSIISGNSNISENSNNVSDSEIVAPDVPKLQETVAAKQPEIEQEQVRPVLDAKKLVELMEEDGKLEEHTREIKTKPENVKPRDSYVENSVDLSEMFKFKR